MGHVERSLLQRSERWSCYISFFDRMSFASLDVNLVGVGPFRQIFPILSFSLGGVVHWDFRLFSTFCDSGWCHFTDD